MIYILYYILSLLQSLHIITGGYILLQSIYTILSLLYYFYIIYIYMYVCIYIYMYINLLCVCCTLRLLRLAILYMSISKAQRTDVATPKSPAQGHLAESDRWWDRWSDRWYLGRSEKWPFIYHELENKDLPLFFLLLSIIEVGIFHSNEHKMEGLSMGISGS